MYIWYVGYIKFIALMPASLSALASPPLLVHDGGTPSSIVPWLVTSPANNLGPWVPLSSSSSSGWHVHAPSLHNGVLLLLRASPPVQLASAWFQSYPSGRLECFLLGVHRVRRHGRPRGRHFMTVV